MLRRRLISSASVCAAAVAMPAILVPRTASASPVVRKNFAALTTAEVDALKAGVAAMKARPATDPTSWTFQAAIHGTLTKPANPAWNQCQHFSVQFFSWHRMYLYWFERILRTASGSPSLTLPYWDWSRNPTIPATFRDTAAGNPLFHIRGIGINGGAALPKSSIAMGGALNQTDFLDFQSTFETTPHGTIHSSVGGDMGYVLTAAQDPIFWLHHCMIDRAWTRWLKQGGGRANPTTATWLARPFSFFDENGTRVAQRTSDTLSTDSQLGYVYDRLPVWAVAVVYLRPLRIPPDVLQQIVRLPPVPPIPADPPPPYRLGPNVDELRIRAAIDHARARSQVEDLRRIGSTLLLSDIAVEGPSLGYFEVYINLPVKSRPDPKDASYVGNLDFFAFTANRSEHEGHGPSVNAIALDLAPALKRLHSVGRLKGQAVELTLIRRGQENARVPEVQAGTVTIGSIRVLR